MLHRFTWGLAGCLIVVGLFAATADAQQPGQGRGRGFGFFGGGASLIGLAGNEAVQKELGLDEAAKGKIETASREANESRREELSAAGVDFGNFQNLSDDERRAAGEKMTAVMRKVNEKSDAKVKEILSADQFKRLKEISIQAAGVGALTNPDVVKELALTDEQTKKIADIRTEYGQKQRDLGRDADREARSKLSEEQAKAATAVLTKEQQDKLAALKGKEFDTSVLRQGRGGQGGDRPGNRPGGTKRTKRPATE